MNGEPIVEKLVIRDGFCYDRIISTGNELPISKAKSIIDSVCEQKGIIKKRGQCKHWLLHNFPDLKPDTRCFDCGMTVQEVRDKRKHQ